MVLATLAKNIRSTLVKSICGGEGWFGSKMKLSKTVKSVDQGG